MWFGANAHKVRPTVYGEARLYPAGHHPMQGHASTMYLRRRTQGEPAAGYTWWPHILPFSQHTTPQFTKKRYYSTGPRVGNVVELLQSRYRCTKLFLVLSSMEFEHMILFGEEVRVRQ